MQAHIAIGDVSFTVCERNPSGIPGYEGTPPTTHLVTLVDVITGETESVVLVDESQAVQMINDFMTFDGPPEGGLFDTKITNKHFKP